MLDFLSFAHRQPDTKTLSRQSLLISAQNASLNGNRLANTPGSGLSLKQFSRKVTEAF